jgi:site-specific recombinase XerD
MYTSVREHLTSKNDQISTHLIIEEIANFIIDRRARRLSPQTIEFYQAVLNIWKKWLEENKITEVESLTPTDIRAYLVKRSETCNPGGVHAHWRSIKAFLFWFEVEYDMYDWRNPIRKVQAPKVKFTPIVGVPMSDVNAMIGTCNSSTLIGARDRAILNAMIDTGARKSEFCNLRIMDLDMNTGSVKIIGGKGNKDRTVFVSPTTRRDINRYLRKRKSKDPKDWLWDTVYGTHLGVVGLRQVLIRRAGQAHVPIPSPHDFRRTFAIECLRNGMDIVQLMYLMGHTTTAVLQRYLAVNDNDLMNVHNQFGPVEHSKR